MGSTGVHDSFYGYTPPATVGRTCRNCMWWSGVCTNAIRTRYYVETNPEKPCNRYRMVQRVHVDVDADEFDDSPRKTARHSNARAVVMDGEVTFPSATDAAFSIGADPISGSNNIRRACNVGNTSYGHYWKFVDEVENGCA